MDMIAGIWFDGVTQSVPVVGDMATLGDVLQIMQQRLVYLKHAAVPVVSHEVVTPVDEIVAHT